MTKILVVDDDIAINNMLCFFLKTGFEGEIISALSGKEAVNKCLTHQPDLVFMDIMMPQQDGVSAIRELRKKGFDNPIVVVTASHQTNDRICFLSGATAIVRKPVNRMEILEQLKHIASFVE